jgi:hypothetical protein
MLTSLSKLQAVNTMLAIIGEAPTNSIVDSPSVDISLCLQILDEVSRDTQSQGWHFNLEHDVELLPNLAGEINLASNILRVDLESHNQRGKDVVVRGLRLYDRKAHTYVFDSKLKATVVYGLSFEELPHAAKNFMMIRAGRILQDRVVGSARLHAFTQQDELLSWVHLTEYEGWTADHTIFDNFDSFDMINRRN